ncbi:MAG: 3-phosphoshikimate 1-carboxyvinyltransferase [Ruminococcaceae bacterium]|nr:3-phosphoshikimate 1-carboxyvinyltransferase [Oscillospiraceae bacterium]
MIAYIRPSRAVGVIKAPPSKSMAHRLLIAAGLAGDESLVSGIDWSEDLLATRDCLRALRTGETLCCRESGSTLRFFIPLALLGTAPVSFTGSERLMSRPLEVYGELCRAQGLLFEKNGRELRVCGPLRSGRFELPGDVSSQFVTGLLFALPLLESESRIVLRPPVESRSYIELTLAALRLFGVEAAWENEYVLRILGTQRYLPRQTAVEGDWSNAAFLSAFNLLGGEVTVEGLDDASLQGDKIYIKHYPALEAGFAEISLADCPDLGPILFAMAAEKHGAHFTETRRLRIKESDRAEAMAAELRKFGADISVGEDEVWIRPADLRAPAETLCGHNDHRIVMALSLLLTKYGGSIAEAEAVRKSYPGFFDDIRKLGIEVEQDYGD